MFGRRCEQIDQPKGSICTPIQNYFVNGYFGLIID